MKIESLKISKDNAKDKQTIGLSKQTLRETKQQLLILDDIDGLFERN